MDDHLIETIKGIEPFPRLLPQGVYFIMREGQCLYIGQSVNPLGRVSEHLRTKRYEGAEAFLLPVEDKAYLSPTEAAMIRRFAPPKNKANPYPSRRRDRHILRRAGLEVGKTTTERFTTVERGSGTYQRRVW